MPNVAVILREEISRLSKKVVRQQVESLRSTAAHQKAQLAVLRKQVALLEREVNRLKRQAGNGKVPDSAQPPSKARFTTKSLKSLRSRLGLSAEDFGKLLGVSAQTIYRWETQKSAPRRAQVPAIAALRGIGKREAQRRLDGDSEQA